MSYNNKPRCNICDCYFKVAVDKEDHDEFVHNQPNKCLVCHISYAYDGYLDKHNAQYHGTEETVSVPMPKEQLKKFVYDCNKKIKLKRQQMSARQVSKAPEASNKDNSKSISKVKDDDNDSDADLEDSGDEDKNGDGDEDDTEEKKYTCTICSKPCRSSGALSHHRLSIHKTDGKGNKVEFKYGCNLEGCSQKFYNSQRLNKHLKFCVKKSVEQRQFVKPDLQVLALRLTKKVKSTN